MKISILTPFFSDYHWDLSEKAVTDSMVGLYASGLSR